MVNTRRNRRRQPTPSPARSPITSTSSATQNTTTVTSTGTSSTNSATNSTTSNHIPISFATNPSAQTHSLSNPKIPKFKGRDDGLEIDAFIAIFERVFRSLKDDDKIVKVVEFLESEAANYFGTEIITDPSATWATAKEKLLKCYGHSKLPPMIAAAQRYLQSNETVKEYYDDKCKILRNANIAETHTADLLTNGLPDSWRELLYGKRFSSLADWLMTIQDIEADQRKDKRNKPRIHFMDSNSRHKGNGPQQSLPICQICKRNKIKAHHWHRDCPLRNPVNSTANIPSNSANTPTQPNPIASTLTLQQLNP